MHSNFITPPDFVITVTLINAAKDDIAMCADAVQELSRPYNVYIYDENMKDPDWLTDVLKRSDVVLMQEAANVPLLGKPVLFGPGQEFKTAADYFDK